MTRTVDLARRAALLDRITDYVVAHGVADLSLRPLGDALGLSPRTLLHHFGSKDAMIAAVLSGVRRRQRVALDRLRRSDLRDPRAIARAALSYLTSDTMLPMMQLFFEVYALALRDPARAPGFLEGAVGDWLEFLADPMCSGTSDPQRARAIATVLLAGYRGFMLDYLATRDSKRVGEAIDVWMSAMQMLWNTEGAA